MTPLSNLHPLELFSVTVSDAFHKLVPRFEPSELETTLIATLANMVGPIADEGRHLIMAAARVPCEQPDCGCEHVRTFVIQALDHLRTDWREQYRTNIPA